MRIVWIIVALLLFAAGAALFSMMRAQPAPEAAALERAAAEVEAAARGGTVIDASPAAATEAVPEAESESATRDALVAELLASAASRRSTGSSDAAVEEDEDGEAIDDGMDERFEGATVARGRVIRRADGTIRADGRFTIRGSGTERDPYRITWDLLISASETFQPRLGELVIPQRVAMLHGRHVRIEGYAAFPLASFDPTEMLVMLNQWDGCCIGVPPTPFDAIEVKLSAAPSQRRAQVSYFGTVTGRFEVEPFLIDSWLVGLYLMDEAGVNLGL